MYGSGKEMTFAVGDKVWLSTRNLKTSIPSMKLDYKRIGPYTACKMINNNAYKLDLRSTIRNHNVFHVSLFNRYAELVGSQPSSEPHPMIVEETQEWEVDCILDSRWRYRKLHTVIQWAGYNHIRTSWEPAEHLENDQDLIDEFHREHQDRP